MPRCGFEYNLRRVAFASNHPQSRHMSHDQVRSPVLATLALAAPLQAQSAWTPPAPGALIAEAIERSEVMENLALPQRRHRPAPVRLARHAPGQRLDRRAVPELRAHRRAGAVRLRGDLGAGPGLAADRGSRSTGPSPAHSWAWTAGTDGKTRKGPGGARRPHHPRQPGALPGPGQGRLGAAQALQSGLESRRAAADPAGFRADRCDLRPPAPRSPPTPPRPRSWSGASSRSTCPTC